LENRATGFENRATVPDLTDQLEQIGVGGKVLLTLKRANQQSTAEIEKIDIGQTAKSE
jgi:hypothetical protein